MLLFIFNKLKKREEKIGKQIIKITRYSIFFVVLSKKRYGKQKINIVKKLVTRLPNIFTVIS